MQPTFDWPAVGVPQALGAGQVHVWGWRLDSIPDAAGLQIASLDPQELKRYHRFHFSRDQDRFAISHLNMRRILAAYLDLNPSEISYQTNSFGKPELLPHTLARQLYFNLSHSRHAALLAISADTEVGVDIEDVKPIESDVAEKYFSHSEQTALASLHGDAWLDGFYRCWTRKEAILKAEGMGIMHLPLSCFDVSLLPGVPARLLDVRPPAVFRCPWTLHDLATPAKTVAALATGSSQSQVSCFFLKV